MFFSPPRPRVLAHRGYVPSDTEGVRISENTLGSFAAAIAAGAEYIETDAHATRDGVAVLVHDQTFVDHAGRTHRVADLTAEELVALPLPCGSVIPSLTDALAEFPLTRFNIDVKERAAIDAVADALREEEAFNRVLVTSFSSARRQGVIEQVPGAFSGAGRSDVLRVLLLAMLRRDAALSAMIRTVQAVQLPGRGMWKRILSEKVIKRIQSASIEVHIWTVNDEAEMRFWLARGADGLVTDETALAVRVVRELNDL